MKTKKMSDGRAGRYISRTAGEKMGTGECWQSSRDIYLGVCSPLVEVRQNLPVGKGELKLLN